jgi:hypothetical protein
MIVALLITTLAVVACVVIHYEALVGLTHIPSVLRASRRGGVLVGVLGALLAHIVEVLVFAGAYMFLVSRGLGSVQGGTQFRDYCYYSLITYTTVGFGDVTPMGAIRFLTGVEALTGLVLITWTASFLFIQMQHHWDHWRCKADEGKQGAGGRGQGAG